MGIRGELFSTRVILSNRTYFFNIKENRTGDLYLNIVESKNRETGGFDRQSVILFAEDLQEFLQGFDESLRVLEKAIREKSRMGGRTPSREPEPGTGNGEKPARVRIGAPSHSGPRSGAPSFSGPRPGAPSPSGPRPGPKGGPRGGSGGKRLVVKKRKG